MNTRMQRSTEETVAAPESPRYKQMVRDASTYWKSFSVDLVDERGRLGENLDEVLDAYIQYLLDTLERESGARMKLEGVAYTAIHYSTHGVALVGTVSASPLPGEHPARSPRRAQRR